MNPFTLQDEPIDVPHARIALADPQCGGYASFEGWVRDHHEGRAVEKLEYEAYGPLAVREGDTVIAEAMQRFDIAHATCIHRVGALAIGEMAVWVGVSAAHRDAAFRACRYIIDEIKHRVPVWKKEYFTDGTSEWVNCAGCVAAVSSATGA